MEKRNVYMEKLEKNLAEFDTKFDEMKAKAAETQDDMKAEYHSQVKKLETKRDDFVIKYGQLKESSGQAWEDVKVGTEKTLSDLKGSIDKALTRFK